MPDKRRAERYRKRVRLYFGRDRCNTLAYTEDISASGIFIRSPNIINPGQPILVKLEVAEGVTVEAEGIVTWAKKVPMTMIHRISKSGMGVRIVRFISGREEYSALMEELHRRSNYRR